MATANTLTATITVVATATDARCHGVQWGARQRGGYYADVSSRFSNSLLVGDADPDGDGNPTDAAIAGRVLLTAGSGTARDAAIVGNAGMGGQRVLAIPLAYNGWVQNLAAVWTSQPTADQRNPAP